MRKLSKILVLVLALSMLFAMASMFTVSAAAQPEYLYLTPNANWKQSNARFAAYFFGNGETWVSMTDSNNDGVYEVKVPTDKVYPNVIFCRMNPSASANNWNNKWNQTADLAIPTGGTNHYTVKEGTWDSGGGTWSTFGSTCTHANLGPAATCTAPQKCLDCGDPVVSELGHTYNSAHLCTRCNEQATFTVAGSGAHLKGEWAPGNTANDMTYADGVYTKVYTNVAAGSYLLKVARDHDWGTAYPSADKAYTVATAGSTVTVTLKGTTVTITVEAPHVHSYEAVVTAPTYTDGGYTTYTCSCGESYVDDYTDKVVPAFPEAVVTPIPGIVDDETTLTFALNFGIKGATIVDGELVIDENILPEDYLAAVFETYGKMYVDYRLKIEGLSVDGVTFNANGNANGFLGGQYDAWSENWVIVPFDDVTIPNGGSLMIMEYAAEMMGKPGLRMVLEEIVSVVVDFDCGVYFTPEFLAANPDMVVTLELIVFNEDENGEPVDVINVAENVFKAHEHNYEAVVTAPTCTEAGYTTYTCACGDTYVDDATDALGHDMVTDAAVAPTCTATGLTEGSHCSRCDHKVAQEEVPMLAHDYKYDVCSGCGAVDPAYASVTHRINFSTWEQFAKETYADGDVYKYNDIFTFIMGKNSRVDASSKTWDDFAGTLRFSFGGKTPTGSVPSKNALQITVDSAYTIKVWYVAGGDARYFALMDAEGTVLSETTHETVKNGQYYAELVIPAAGTYYFGVPADNNYIFQIELVKHEHTAGAEATCTTAQTCTVCGATLADALGHSYEAAVTAPTCTSVGYTTYTCACGDTYTADEVAALEHEYVYGKCTVCGATDPNYVPHVNTLVVGDTNKIVVDGDTFNDYNLPIEWVAFVADEKATYTFVGDAGTLVFIFDAEFNLLCGGTGSATLEAGTYLICIGNGLVGELNVAVTKTALPHEHVWSDATCTEPAKCECGETQGEALGHDFADGVCTRCEAADPDHTPVQPGGDNAGTQEPTGEDNWFASLWAMLLKFFEWLSTFFKGMFA